MQKRLDETVSRWTQFTREINKLVHFWLFGVLGFLLYRISFVILFKDEIQTSLPVSIYSKVFLTGLRSDAVVMAYFIAIPLIFTLILSYYNRFKLISKIREVVEYIFLFILVTLSLVSLNYYKEFGNIFDNNLFLGLLEEDKGSVFKMLLKQDGTILFLIFYLLTLAGTVFLFKRTNHFTYIPKTLSISSRRGIRSVLVIGIVYLFCASLRGSFSLVHHFRVRNSAVCSISMLNKSILNPVKAFEVSFKDYKEINKLADNNPFSMPTLNDFIPFKSVKDVIKRQAYKPAISKPKQIFLVIMESYDAWSLEDKYQDFNVSVNLKQLADNGTSFTNFLPAYNATIYAYTAIVSGVPYFGVNLAQTPKAGDKSVSSIFSQFEELGYETNLFYGGFLSWQNIDDYSRALSCDNFYSAADIDADVDNECWGVEDEALFDMVVEKLDSTKYSFNVILTTSFHSPYPVDVESKGFPYKTVEDIPESVRKYFGDTMSLHEFGHRWYGDLAIGQFMKQAEELYPDALYAYTGDHFARKFINANPTLYEKSLVPFILYGKGIPAQKLDTPGSHIDIIPTLLDLVAPEDFTYYSFGSSMLNPTKPYGVGYNKLITRDALYYQVDDHTIQKTDRKTEKETLIDVLPYQAEYQKIMGLAWHYIAKGNRLL